MKEKDVNAFTANLQNFKDEMINRYGITIKKASDFYQEEILIGYSFYSPLRIFSTKLWAMVGAEPI